MFKLSVLSLLSCLTFGSLLVQAAPRPRAVSSSGGASASTPPPPSATVALASDNPNDILWTAGSNIIPQPVRGSLGYPMLGPMNVPIDIQNADFLAPPSTDSGTIPNAKWPMSLSHNRLQTGGWARQQNTGVMPLAASMSGVNMRLEKGAIRELHWHTAGEWAYIIAGTVQVTAVDTLGRNDIATLNAGDIWFFPPGIPHSLQGGGTDGTEFLLIFATGNFNEDNTFLLTDWLAHVPKEVIAKNFGTNLAAWNNLPGSQLYIFPSTPLPPNQQNPISPAGEVPEHYTYALSNVTATPLAGGSIKIADTTNFPISTEIAVAEVTVEPGAMRELHWHPVQDEWSFFITGNARVTLFAASSTARTYDYQAGDVGFVPASYGHYVENVGNTTLKYLEAFNSPVVQDISLSQWLALVPPELVQAHLGIDAQTLASLNKTKPIVVAPSYPT